MSEIAVLALEDGSVFRGTALGTMGITVGEVVFNMAMTGYQEILQIRPMQANSYFDLSSHRKYWINREDSERRKFGRRVC